MKLIDEKALRKSSKAQSNRPICKAFNQPNQISLRSRTVQIFHDQSQELCKHQNLQNPHDCLDSNPKSLKKVGQSPLKHKSKEPASKQPKTTAKKPQTQPIPLQSNFSSEDEQPDNAQSNVQDLSPRKKRVCRLPTLRKIIHCEYYKDVTEVDFITYFGILAKKKMFSTLLINEYGQVIFADRLGSEHFEGSLNNFARNPIYSTILHEKLDEFFQKVSWIDPRKRNILKLVIYSKNSKRRYSKKGSNNTLTNSVIFNRYLRCVSCEIKPIRITLSSTDQFEGYWNKSLIEENAPLNCYLMTSRLSKELPDLEKFELQEDRKIQKFLRYTNKKQAQRKKRIEQRKQFQKNEQDSEKQQSIDEQQMHEDSQIYSHKESENIMIEMAENNKHSKSALTMGYVLNSGEGKFLNDAERI